MIVIGSYSQELKLQPHIPTGKNNVKLLGTELRRFPTIPQS